MQIRRARPLSVVAVLLAMAVAGCGGSAGPSAPGATSSPNPGASAGSSGVSQPSEGTATSPPPAGTSTQQASSIQPGHGTPADAVDGYLKAVLAGNGTLACSYLSSDGGSCPATVQATGSFTIGSTVVNSAGTYALVEVTGRICISGSGCESNTNPSTGMPTGKETVDQAIADAEVTGNGFSPMICIIGSNGGWDISVNLS